MLNEIYSLWQALERAQLVIPREHPRVKSPGSSTGPCLRVRLDEQGRVTAVEAINEDEWPGLWTVMEGNHNSFPVVRIKEPLCDVSQNSEIWERLGFDENGKRKKPPSDNDRISALIDTLENRCKLSTQREQQFWLRLQGKAKELLQHANDTSPESETLREFARRFQEASNNPNILFREISERALLDVQSARLDELDTVETLLIGGAPRARGQHSQISIQIAFDLHNVPSLPQQLYRKKIQECVKRILPTEQKSSKGKHPARVCAFTGKEQPLQVSPFPTVGLPELNKRFPLTAMFSDAACNTRYGLTDSFIVPVAKGVARQTQDALTWIVAEERRGKTWRGVASGKFETTQGRKKERFDLLIVYVDSKPDLSVNVADFFGTDEAEQQKRFEVDAKAVCDALDGINKECPGSKLNIFLLRKASEGQAHVVVAESPSVEDILRAAQWWQQAAANMPKVTLLLPGKKGERAILGEPKAPYPDQVVRLLSEEWVTNGVRANKVSSIGLGEVLDLMLRTPGKWEFAAQHMLDLTVRRLGPLLLGVFGAMHTNDSRRLDNYPLHSREIGLRAVSTLGILLDAMGRRKERYMSGTAFLVGRLLSLADTLHREYCRYVRGGDIPPQLMGNALMPVAADNPEDAMDRLRERMMIYKAWADKGKSEEFRLAKWAVGQIGEICFQLSQLPLPPETNQTFRAELFLGYMARSPAEKDTDDQSTVREGE